MKCEDRALREKVIEALMGVDGLRPPFTPRDGEPRYDLYAFAILTLISEDRQRLSAEVAEVLEPFAEAIENADDPRHSATTNVWESPVAIVVTYGDFRAAASLYARLKDGQHEGR